MLDTTHLQYILTIAQEGSLLAASHKLFVTPSALSQLVSRLETELDTLLFKRTKQGWIPTHAGELYIEMAKDIILREKNTLIRISDIAENQAGHFTVGVTAGRGTRMFAAVLPRFRESYPKVRVGLVEGSVLQINKAIAEGRVDVGFVTNTMCYPNVITRHQAHERIVLAVPRSHPAAELAGKQKAVDMAMFREDDFLLAGEGTTLRTIADQAFAQAGFCPRVAFETHSVSTLHALANGGFGLSFVPEFYTGEDTDAVYFELMPPRAWELVAATRSGCYVTRAQEHFINLVTEYYHR